jgi:hypothetical protein
MKVSGQIDAPAALLPNKDAPVRIGQEAVWTSEPVWTQWRREKILSSAGNRVPVVQSVSNSVIKLTGLVLTAVTNRN